MLKDSRHNMQRFVLGYGSIMQKNYHSSGNNVKMSAFQLFSSSTCILIINCFPASFNDNSNNMDNYCIRDWQWSPSKTKCGDFESRFQQALEEGTARSIARYRFLYNRILALFIESMTICMAWHGMVWQYHQGVAWAGSRLSMRRAS